MPITAGALRDAGGRLLLGCRCGWQRWANLAAIPQGLEGQTIGALHESGRWPCGGCGKRAAVMVYEQGAGTLMQTERYAGDAAPD